MAVTGVTLYLLIRQRNQYDILIQQRALNMLYAKTEYVKIRGVPKAV